MKQISAFFPGFHRAGLGRKPLAWHLKTAKLVRLVDSFCLTHLEVLFGGVLPAWLAGFKTLKGVNSRKRVFTPALTFWLFLSQVLDPGGSCRRALSRMQGLCNARKLRGISDSTGAYCKARARLSAKLLIRVFRHVCEQIARAGGDFGNAGGRLLVMDGTSFTLPDSTKNRAVYSYAPGQKPGCGFPVLYALGLFDLRTGACLKLLKSARVKHDSALAWKTLEFFRPGDILVADRAFCSFAFLAELADRGVHVVMRLHQARAKVLDMRKGRKLGRDDVLQQWHKPPQSACKGMHPMRWESMADYLEVRIIKASIACRGHRPAPMYFATTLLDERVHDAKQIAAIYLRRWEVEVFFDDIKTSMGMEMLRCESPDMVARELLMHMIAYNLVRLLMLNADKLRPAGEPGKLSFKGTLDRINEWHGVLWGCCSRKQVNESYAELLRLISEDVIVPRPGRREPRVLKRRRDSYGLLSQPRSVMRRIPAPSKAQLKGDSKAA